MTVSLIIIATVSVVLALWALHSLRKANGRLESFRNQYDELRFGFEKLKAESESRLHAADAAVGNERVVSDSLRSKIEELTETCSRLTGDNSALATRIEMMNNEAAERESLRQEQERLLESRFVNLANDILRQNTSDLKAQNEERLKELLLPLHTNIEEFKRTVTDTYNSEARERFSLSERIKELMTLNNSISRQAQELSEALRGDSKIQGDWGEMVLETILEKSGLQEGVEYFTQSTKDESGNTLRNEDGSLLRPDVVVRYPDSRFVVIDSKMSLTAFVDYANAVDDESRESASQRHIRSVRKHVDELARKRYQDYVGGEGKLDFVMMFIPTEPAYIAAMRLDPSIWQNAYDRNVLIVSPTHLVSGLKMISQLWVRDRHTRNVITIAEEAGKMYDKFADFTKDIEKIGKSISSTQKAYDDALNKLSSGTGNLVSRARKLQALGVKANKQIASGVDRDESDDVTQQ